ncbi:hypothetical protein [Roseivivax sp. CAU 1753]
MGDLVALAQLQKIDALARLRDAKIAEDSARDEAVRITGLQRAAIEYEGQDAGRRVSAMDPAWATWLGQRRATLNQDIARARVLQAQLAERAAYHLARHAALEGLKDREDEMHRRLQTRKANAQLQAQLLWSRDPSD